MKYEKPSVALLASATDVIQGGQGKGDIQADVAAPHPLNSVGAYEADE